MAYRPDIDGLRALAIVPVVLFHMGLAGAAPGGFIGVDIFFVISGYLITKNIYSSIVEQNYSVTEFYSRRVRRIFPALFVVYLFCIAAALFVNFPSEAGEIGTHLLSSIFFVSNISFYYSSGYFDQKAEFNPLLHTWSLSVEEQFYIIFPLLVLCTIRLRRRNQALVLLAVALLSFAASAWMVLQNPSAAFYLVPYRAWELLTGSLLALSLPMAPPGNRILEVLGLGGLVAIFASTQLISPTTTFPGPAALGACLGAAALIYSGSKASTLSSRFLSLPPLRFVGLISYSLYLWHWPIYVVARHFHEPVTYAEKLPLIMLSLVAATLSWRFIERPFRSTDPPLFKRTPLLAGGLAMASVVVLALLLGPVSHSLWPVPASAEKLLAFENYNPDPPMRAGACFLKGKFNHSNLLLPDQCLTLSPDKKNILIIGDSHAAHLWAGLETAFPEFHFLQATAIGCRPLVETEGERFCVDLIQYIFNAFLPNHHVDGIILSGRWRLREVDAAFQTAKYLRQFAGLVIISGPIVEYDQPLPRLLALEALHDENGRAFIIRHQNQKQQVTDQAFASLQLPPGIKYFSAYQVMTSKRCGQVTGEGTPVQFDYGHLTGEGSLCLAEEMRPLLFDTLSLLRGPNTPGFLP